MKLILTTSSAILINQSLQRFLAIALQLGNFINSVSPKYFCFVSFKNIKKIPTLLQGTYAGNAKGFKLSALQHLEDFKSPKKHWMTLLHFIVAMETDNPHLLDFATELSSVKDASKLSLETIFAELRNWKSQVANLQEQALSLDSDFAKLMNGL